MAENAFGYDYGTKPKVMVVADIEFSNILRNSCIGLGYGQVPNFGDLSNVPLLTMLFRDLESGDNAFHILMIYALLLEMGTQSVLDLWSSMEGIMGYVSTQSMNN